VLRKEDKYGENKANFEGSNGLTDLAQIWNASCPTPRKFALKIVHVSVQVRLHKNGIFFTLV